MKGDFSKDTFRKKKHFHDVRMQQGRVMLDTDWNEQADITSNRIETGTLDIIGKTGAPFHYAGFGIIPVDGNGNPANPGINIKISEGRFYVDGILCENDSDVLFADQPDFDKTALPKAAGRYIFYLDVWQRHISVVEDPEIREVALGGPDTTTRSKTVWQIRYFKGNNTNTCVDLLPASVTDPSTGLMKARSELPTGTDNPCGLETSGGYRRLENQLYRVEIHKGGANRASTTFKWSRDNGSVEVKWESIDASNANNLVVSSTGRDELPGFKSSDWVELIDDRTDLLGLPGVLVQLSKVDNNILTINPATIKDAINPTATKLTISNINPRIRRWDSPGGEISLNTNNNTWIALEDGVEVNFREGTFKTGDYWLIPARTATADIEWPFADPQPPQGIKHHFAKLAILDLSTGGGNMTNWAPVGDCRQIFPPLTELVSLFNASYNDAANVSYKSNCTNWSGIAPDTVAKALDALCESKETSKSCSFTIGPKGDFKTLLEAIENLVKKQKDISLCFMPGEHTIDKEILMLNKEMMVTTLKITGYAARITMKAKRMELAAEKLILQGISLTANPENNKEDDTQILLSSGEIIMEYCSWFRGGVAKLPFIIIYKEGLVHLNNNKFLASLSLVPLMQLY